MYRHENPVLFDAKERYYLRRRGPRAQSDFRQAIDELGSAIKALEDHIIELTTSAIEVHRAEEDKP